MNREKNAEKTCYTVGDICALTGITRKTLFFYDRNHLLPPKDRVGPQNAKIYGSEDIARLREILNYRRAGLLLREIGEILDHPGNRERILHAALVRAKAQHAEKEEEIARLNLLLQEAESKRTKSRERGD